MADTRYSPVRRPSRRFDKPLFVAQVLFRKTLRLHRELWALKDGSGAEGSCI